MIANRYYWGLGTLSRVWKELVEYLFHLFVHGSLVDRKRMVVSREVQDAVDQEIHYHFFRGVSQLQRIVSSPIPADHHVSP